ncbi:Cytochrome c [Flavobacterium resistens]|uniref:C-type cytochrome n=1 Tax=Flavobacterium resistens TaxID=443612 RepID=A0A521E6X1_9FLAO|nr:cytochrome c [Flavobacterium resistens]MRX69196.1 c-type cytochrome [Flavobacterium resistens]SMO79151.1 Cytochrome c [Flavobacterium resistens]
MKKIRILLFSLTAIIVVSTGIIMYLKIFKKSEIPECGTHDLPSCGNIDLTENQKKGKEVFNSNCAACHKLNSKITGPALHEVDSIVFVNWLTNKKHKIDSSKVEILAIDYHKTVFSKTLSKEDIAHLIEYCHSK